MTRQVRLATALGLGAALASGVAPLWAANAIDAETAETAEPWTSLAANDADANFHFVIVGDRTGGARPGVFESVPSKVDLLEPAFVLSIGDLIEGYTEDSARLAREWDAFERIAAGFKAPFFHVAGNHDMSNAVMARAWRERFGPSYYHFVYKDVLFLVLNSELFGMVGAPGQPVPGPWTQSDQMAFIETTLDAFPNPHWTIVLLHQPLWDRASGPPPDWARVETLLGARDYTVFAGHFHRYVKHIRNDRKFITLATSGGGSSLRGPRYGEFDHVVLVTMTDAGPRIANLMLDGIHDEDVLTAPARAALWQMAGTVYPFRPRAVRSVPVFGSGETFEQGVVAFEATNPGAAALRVAYHVDAGPHMRYAGAPRPFTLAAGAKRRIEIPLTAPAVPYRDLAPGRVSWSLSTATAEGPARLALTNALLPASRLPLPAGAPPVVDGELDDWTALPFAATRQGDVATAPTAATDISFRFALREADGALAFAAEVTDDNLVASSNLGPRQQDALLLVVDARPLPDRALNLPLFSAARHGHLERMAVAYLTPGAVADDPELAFLAEPFAAVTWRARRTPSGFTAEAVVSGAFLDNAAGRPWETVRISVVAIDWDEGEADNRIAWHVRGSSATVLHWRPDRFGDAPAAGTGTFTRSR